MMNFKIQGFFTTLIIGTVSVLTISDAISQKVNAQATPSCNNATIKGSYGSILTGTVLGYPLAQVGLFKFNGTGNLQGIASDSYNGTLSINTPGSGTYSVKQDCTVQIVISGDTFSGVIVDNGKEIFLLSTAKNAVVTVTLKKVN
ncbi:hypothetical protein [Nostoc sp.]|uniref:hypothetical protein n=1 Tax=Nostoc sp. TaxID=1180 RepID=UPI002FF82B9E